MPQIEANWLLLDDTLKIIAHGKRKYAYQHDDTSTMAIIGQKPTGVIDGDLAPGAYTEIDLDNLTHEHITKGDTVNIYDPETMTVVESVVCGADVLISDAKLYIDLQTTTKSILDNYIIALDQREKLASQSLQLGGNYSRTFMRTLYCRTTNATITECTTNGLAGSGIVNRIVVPLDSSMTCEMTFEVKQQASANHRTYKRVATFVNNGGTVTMPEAVVTPYADYGTVALAACAVTITPNNTNDAIKVEFTGIPLTALQCSVTVVCTISKYG